MAKLSLCLAQLDFTVGAIHNNTALILKTLREQGEQHDIIVFPELAITGYPPEDLLFRDDLHQAVDNAVEQISAAASDCVVIVGHPQAVGGELFNAMSVLHRGECLHRYFKQRLPNYGVFDEQRYFIPGHQSQVFEWQGVRIGLQICEDLWHPQPLQQLLDDDIDLVLSINASPYELNKHEQRLGVLKQRVAEAGKPILYLNNCGAQDELVFDGHSLVLDAEGELVAELPHCEMTTASVTYEDKGIRCVGFEPKAEQNDLAHVYDALVLAVRDYVTKNGFSGVVLGLSGGIDSALTLAIASDALGADKVHAVMMPFRYTSDMSLEDAEKQADTLGVRYDVVPIEPMFNEFMTQLGPLFGETETDTTEENLQSRCRGVLLMALSNKTGSLVLATGNKSEMAVGYATLYGDMCGGFAPIKDIPKLLVYQLAEFRNTRGACIPQRVIDRPPSAELAPDQVDSDSLPDYSDLDRILALYVERDWSVTDIIAAGFVEEDVRRVVRLVDLNEYKRRQSAVGPKVTPRNFGKDRRYPITSHYRHELQRQGQ
ncbi:NAD+ synthase [Idiomarina loihiensis]|uniref:Glutamine-dependent NAD(+) synthetase n=1 Tax=Idiomarina loihiensis (strain ATCC BAA-735 / DSM 15497 / L2-TR) TaxID=283942 RepID=Q5QTU2_IDILO|nr:NAD+ synthase [Idiomarina loihiensis]AAV82026.1 NAD synthase [Idiomarina loihiensis L2TR]AGM36056.1 NAD synthetase [Idiomarina loihiensis GSL 199]